MNVCMLLEMIWGGVLRWSYCLLSEVNDVMGIMCKADWLGKLIYVHLVLMLQGGHHFVGLIIIRTLRNVAWAFLYFSRHSKRNKNKGSECGLSYVLMQGPVDTLGQCALPWRGPVISIGSASFPPCHEEPSPTEACLHCCYTKSIQLCLPFLTWAESPKVASAARLSTRQSIILYFQLKYSDAKNRAWIRILIYDFKKPAPASLVPSEIPCH